jgi:hypothetical protein
VGLLDFTFEDYETETERSEVVHEIKLKNQNNAIFYDKLTYIYLEIPNFHKEESELESRLDKWLYFIKHLVDLTEIPRIFGGEDVFVSAFHKAELVNLDPTEKASYEASLKVYRDLKGVIDTAREEGRMEGELIGLEKGVNLGMEKAAAQLVARGMTEAEARSMLGLD